MFIIAVVDEFDEIEYAIGPFNTENEAFNYERLFTENDAYVVELRLTNS